MTTRSAPRTVLILAALLLAGCAPADPYSDDTARPSTGAPPTGQAGPRSPAPEFGELPGRAPRALLDEETHFPRAGKTPEATLRSAALLFGNWTSATAPARLRRIAALSVDQAHAELSQAAAQALNDGQQGGARSRATVEAARVRGTGERRVALVVTRERVAAPDLPSAGWRYRVTTATLERRPDGWVISRWAPQP